MAFYNCSSLTSITIPEGVTSIGNSAFSCCSNLTSVHITDLTAWCKISFGGVDSNPLCYAHNLYLNGELITDLVIPEGVTSIGDYAFDGCSKLTSITIPDGVTRIGNYAFSGCRGLTSITIPDSVTSIGDDAFYGCSKLIYNEYNNGKYLGNANNLYVCLVDVIDTTVTAFTIPETTKIIYSSAFEYCSSLTSITIPEGVTSIGDNAFYGCSNLTSITIPDSVTNINSYAFHGCKKLTSIIIPSSAEIYNLHSSNNYGVL